MSHPQNCLAEANASSKFLEMLPAKAYVPPKSRNEPSPNCLAEKHLNNSDVTSEDGNTPAKKRRSSSTSTVSSTATCDGTKKAFLPLALIDPLGDGLE